MRLGHSRRNLGLFLRGNFCDRRGDGWLRVALGPLVGPGVVAVEMRFHLSYQVRYACVPVLAGTAIRHIAKSALDRVGAWTVGGPQDKSDAGSALEAARIIVFGRPLGPLPASDSPTAVGQIVPSRDVLSHRHQRRQELAQALRSGPILLSRLAVMCR
jgi:hypothetical protein